MILMIWVYKEASPKPQHKTKPFLVNPWTKPNTRLEQYAFMKDQKLTKSAQSLLSWTIGFLHEEIALQP